MKKEKAAVQQMEQAPAHRYQADISNGLSQEQIQERIDGGWTNETVTAESKTVGQIIKGNLRFLKRRQHGGIFPSQSALWIVCVKRKKAPYPILLLRIKWRGVVRFSIRQTLELCEGSYCQNSNLL